MEGYLLEFHRWQPQMLEAGCDLISDKLMQELLLCVFDGKGRKPQSHSITNISQGPLNCDKQRQIYWQLMFSQLLPKPCEKLEHHAIAAPVANMYLALTCLTTAFN